MADALREIGYSCTSDKDRCRQTLTQLGGVREVTATAVAQVWIEKNLLTSYVDKCFALNWLFRHYGYCLDGLHMASLNA